MFTFIFEGKLYKADSLKELTKLLKQAGCNENIEELYDNLVNNKFMEEVLEEEAKATKEALEVEAENIEQVKEVLEAEYKMQQQFLTGINLDDKKSN